MEAKPSTSLRSGTQGAHYLPPLTFLCRTVLVFLIGSFLFSVIYYIQMLLYPLILFGLKRSEEGGDRSQSFKIYITGSICTSGLSIVQ